MCISPLYSVRSFIQINWVDDRESHALINSCCWLQFLGIGGFPSLSNPTAGTLLYLYPTQHYQHNMANRLEHVRSNMMQGDGGLEEKVEGNVLTHPMRYTVDNKLMTCWRQRSESTASYRQDPCSLFCWICPLSWTYAKCRYKQVAIYEEYCLLTHYGTIDDATSSTVQIQFHTASPSGDPTKPNLSAKCEKITFRNNGIAFRPEDWARLKRIAEGNPGKWIMSSSQLNMQLTQSCIRWTKDWCFWCWLLLIVFSVWESFVSESLFYPWWYTYG